MKRSRRRGLWGLSLVETVVAFGVLLLLMSALAAIYVRSSTVWRKVDHDTALLRNAQVVVRTLERDIGTSHPVGLTKADQALAFLTLETSDDTIVLNDLGKPLWQAFIVFYVDDDKKLKRRRISLPAPSTDARSFEEEFGETLSEYLADRPLDPLERVVLPEANVTRFALEPAGLYGSLHILELELEETGSSSERDTINLKTDISLRNR